MTVERERSSGEDHDFSLLLAKIEEGTSAESRNTLSEWDIPYSVNVWFLSEINQRLREKAA